MNKSLKKLALAASVAAMFGPALDAQAGIAFRNDGVGPLLDVGTMEIGAGNYMFQGIGPNHNGGDFNFFGQSVISDFLSTTGTVTAAAGFEYTVVFGRTLVQNLTAASLTGVAEKLGASLELDAGDITQDFFKIYYGAKNINNQAGTGFNDGLEILSGKITTLSDFSLTNNSSINVGGAATSDTKDLRLLDSRPGGDFSTTTTVSPSNPAARTFPTVLTVTTTGAADFVVQVTSSNALFFNGAPNFISAHFTILPNSQFNTPFTTTAPSTSFTAIGAAAENLGAATQGDFLASAGLGPTNVDLNGDLVTDTLLAQPDPDGAGPLAANAGDPNITGTSIVQSLRCVHGAIGVADTTCDFIAQGSGSASMAGTFIPEPGSLALLGLGLALSGMMARRRTAAARVQA